MENPITRRVIKFIFFFSLLVITGTLSYSMIEGWRTQDSLYMTIITMSTVGFGETHELSPGGRLFTLCLILMSIVCMSCLTAGITSLIVGGDISGAFEKRKAIKMASQLEHHSIICGSGELAQAVLERLVRKRQPVSLVDDDNQQISQIRQRYPRVPIVEDSPKDELVLANANLLQATSVVAATESEFDNLLIAMTCKDLNSKIKVFALSMDPSVASRMAKIGVDAIICPFQLGGEKVVQLIDQSANDLRGSQQLESQLS